MIHYSPTTVAKRFLHTSLALRHSPLPAKFKAEVQRAMWKLDSAPLAGRNSIELMGRNLAFAGEVAFRHVFTEVFANACYYFEADTDAPVILDCGSNIGMSVLFFKRLYPKARVIAFEPDPTAFGLLNANIRSFGLRDVTSHQAALGAADGTVAFHSDPSASLTMSTNPERHPGAAIAVPMRALSAFIAEPVDMLKLDVEGSETAVMQELAASGKLALVRAMHMEYHHHIGSAVGQLSAMLKLLEAAGFDYQINAERGPFAAHGQFQDISLYCYRRK